MRLQVPTRSPEEPHRPPLGAVLAGGAARRLGGAKARVDLAGRPLASYPAAAFAAAGVECVLVAKPASHLPELGLPVLLEPEEPLHPLLGVTTALRHASGRPVLSCPCDMPFVSSALLRKLTEAGRAAVVRSGGRVHPLLALYTPNALQALEEALTLGLSATAALEHLLPVYIEASERETFNVNTPEDLRYAASIVTRAL